MSVTCQGAGGADSKAFHQILSFAGCAGHSCAKTLGFVFGVGQLLDLSASGLFHVLLGHHTCVGCIGLCGIADLGKHIHQLFASRRCILKHVIQRYKDRPTVRSDSPNAECFDAMKVARLIS